MDRQMLLDHLAEAERHVEEGTRLLERERAAIEERRRRGGPDVPGTEELLRTMEESQKMHLDHLERIRKELAELG
ncbi:MAG: hypothetical protein JOZ89_01955 [Gammaproteobacteria bacterium]|nr:hypothetical protein [Gammaproteobacteria bacterium]